MSGPPKTPTHLRLVRGNPSKRPINKNEPQPPAGVPPTPKHFDKQAKYWFKRMAEELDAVGVISQLDARALELLVEAYTEYTNRETVSTGSTTSALAFSTEALLQPYRIYGL